MGGQLDGDGELVCWHPKGPHRIPPHPPAGDGTCTAAMRYFVSATSISPADPSSHCGALWTLRMYTTSLWDGPESCESDDPHHREETVDFSGGELPAGYRTNGVDQKPVKTRQMGELYRSWPGESPVAVILDDRSRRQDGLGILRIVGERIS